MRRVLVVGRIFDPPEDSHHLYPRVEKIVEVKVDDGEGMIGRGRYLVNEDSSAYVRGMITQYALTRMLRGCADLRGESWRKR